MTNIQETVDQEKYWQELRHHIEWTQGFGLYFYFTDNTKLLNFLKERLQQFLMGQTTRLQTITYHGEDSHWVESTLEKLLSRDAKWKILHAPVWLDLNQKGSSKTTQKTKEDYLNLLLRLNERRDSLRKHYHSHIILSFPLSFQADCRLAAPDLWSVRNFSETIMAENKQVSASDTTPKTTSNTIKENTSSLSKKYQQTIINEWERLETHTTTNNIGVLRTSQRAVLAYLKLGEINKAFITAAQSVEIAKNLLTIPPSPESLRDLSVSLDNVGNVAQQQGRWNDAHENYKESLDIRRRLSEMLGETPESLRDLSVSLYNLASFFEHQGEMWKAQETFQEGFDIGKRLAKMQPDIPAYTEIITFFEKKVKKGGDG